MKKENLNFLPLLLIAFIWSTTNYINKDLLSNVGPFTILLVRFGIAFLILTSILLINKRNIFQNWKVGIITGFVVAIFYSLYNFSLITSSPVNASFIVNSSFIFIPFLALFIEKKKIVIFDLFSISLAILGLYYIGGNLGGFQFGDILAIFGALFYALYIVLVNNYAAKEDVLVEVNQQFFVVVIFSTIGHYIQKESLTISDNAAILQLLYLAIFPTLICFLLLNWAEKKVSPLLSSFIISLDAVLTAIYGLMIGQVTLSWVLLLGILLFQLALLSNNEVVRKKIVIFILNSRDYLVDLFKFNF